uniref:Uncharacterized protein n=1 Tax=Ananas comosus var. bracteatus TaxID=296719 RepID=A0A6V7QFE2_ANACO|nr:unnamed protein product [Ananas comosus var. bracteatus]
MFSIAAINDTDSGAQWEPLAPTKEAQEFHLSQKYHEGLLKLQAKDYAKARELLEAVLKDPLVSSAQVDKIGNSQHLLQLRFLSLKNLATAFLEQGSTYYESALQCYLQAVELDANDSVIWNQLGTLSCAMGLLSTSRWAFEQGLLSSPKNWNCMEKLLEVLIAIRDEVACLSVANLILRHWPSHSRASHVRKTIEDAEPVPFAPRGIDKLEPKHVKLKFPNKRKLEDNDVEDNKNMVKRKSQYIRLQLTGATWSALLDAILSLFINEPTNGDTGAGKSSLGIDKNAEGLTSTKIDIQLPINTNISAENGKEKTHTEAPVGESTYTDSYTMIKEKNISTDKEHPHERRSTRLERLRSRKSGKDELETTSKDMAKAVFQFLESFILGKPSVKDNDSSGNSYGSCPDILSYTSDVEYNDVTQFISKVSKNYCAHHVGHLLLEEVAFIDVPFQDYFIKFLELEKFTRHCGLDRSPLCCLFLAEICYDQGSCSSKKSRCSEFYSEASYHLCKVIELAALDSPVDLVASQKHFSPTENMEVTKGLKSSTETSVSGSVTTDNSAFWVRFFWLSGCLSLSSGCEEKAHKEFSIALSLLRTNEEPKESSDFIFLPHCKIIRFLTVDRILHEINLIKLNNLLRINDETIKRGPHIECINFLSPLLLSTKDVHLDFTASNSEESERAVSLELSALDALISACEKVEPINIKVYLNCLWRKLQILTVAAGMAGSSASQKHGNLFPRNDFASDLDVGEHVNKNSIHMVVGAVKDISRSTSLVRNFIDQSNNSDCHDGFSSLVNTISDIQSLLLTVMCAAVKMILIRRLSSSVTSNHADQLDSWCLVDSAIAFCKLQHLDPSVSVKTQVDLIAAVHDLLAEYGLCCAGRDGEGEEGTFLKFAIKHLLALDVKLKSQHCTNGKEENTPLDKNTLEEITPGDLSAIDEQENSEEENEIDKVQSAIDSALDQSFFCLYGLKINPDSSSEDDLAMHKNTSRGDYQTKEQCADVFQYILPYAKALSRAGLIKLRRVLRAIRKHFPQPPDDILAENAIDRFLDGPDLCEKQLCEVYETNGSRDSIMNLLFTNGRGPETFKKSSVPYLEVYANLYYFIAQAEDNSATDKYAGFVLKKEGEEFVEQNANLFKYDLLYNPLRFESWQKLANIYDEEVDLLLNDGSKHINILDWRKNTDLPQRVEMGRRHSRRCLLMSLTLASTPIQQAEIHELLALVYNDSIQNVVPFYDQRSLLPAKDATWIAFCQNSMKHFEQAFALRPEWLHAFYLGKLSEKLGHSPAKAFSYYSKAAVLNPSAVDPVYRMHASRLKLLYTRGKQNLDVLKVCLR